MVKVEGNGGISSYRVHFGDRSERESPPSEEDLKIPNSEKPAIDRIVNQLELQGKPPGEVARSVERFFREEFKYSLELAGKGNSGTALSAFLLEHRSGHCEYFASATALLLRAVGIPTRYAVGYSVREYSSLEQQFIVRARNAHAWTMVYLNGSWQVLDTTPPDWFSIEDRAAPSWEFIFDWFSWCMFKLQQGLQSVGVIGGFRGWIWVLLPLSYPCFRWLNRQRQLHKREVLKDTRQVSHRGEDSEFYLIEKALNESGYPRDRAETVKHWLSRVQRDRLTADLVDRLHAILELHYRYRFDPQGIRAEERAQLKSSTEAWLNQYEEEENAAAEGNTTEIF
ncbi:MAG: DUF4129 domain-containing transglutaminase family protein [Synechococcus sp.]